MATAQQVILAGDVAVGHGTQTLILGRFPSSPILFMFRGQPGSLGVPSF